MKQFVVILAAGLTLWAAEEAIAPLGTYTAMERRHWAFQPRKDAPPPGFAGGAADGRGDRWCARPGPPGNADEGNPGVAGQGGKPAPPRRDPRQIASILTPYLGASGAQSVLRPVAGNHANLLSTVEPVLAMFLGAAAASRLTERIIDSVRREEN